ncbi:BTAD domain-containing putative transcriptional regulator [Actinokineospora pegani]|uniref:BTAD domain-containing putative transcriptional regulator n=1 Tax=Actinokineospora pegani TaxID=2654637 RepID=UPI0018D34BD4|nr:BTAD domain-containing putative transcriptional regulator [Actinokineospora pegani]
MSTGNSLSVALLGEPAACYGERAVQLGGGLRLAVFSALALRAGSIVSRPELINAVWGQHAPVSASGSLYTYISALRRALEPDRARGSGTISGSNSGYRLSLAPDELDVNRLVRLRDKAYALRDAGDTDGELGVLEEALGLWRGEALAGVPGPLAEAHRARLAEARLAVVQRRATLVIADGRSDEVVDELIELVRRHPAREAVHGLLMTSLFRAGRQTDALEAYRTARSVLVDRFDTEPGHELRTLHQRILAGDMTVGQLPTPTRTHRTRRTPSPARGSTPFVGRAEVVARVRAALAAVAEGRGGSVWIDGPAGGGKTALLAEALSGDAVATHTVAWACGDELTQQIPFHALDKCLDDLGARLPRPAASPLGASAGAQATAAMEHVRQVVGAHIAGPLVLVLDDLHWADPESLAAWHQLRGLTEHRPLLLVAAARPLPCRREMHLAKAFVTAEALPLPPLTEQEAHDLLGRLGEHPAAAARTMVALAGGNPAYLVAMAEAVPQHGHAHRWRSVPGPVVAAVVRHVDQLSPLVGEALRAMALLGETCAVADLAVATNTPASGLVDVLGEALQAGAVHAEGSGVRFSQPLVRRVLYESVPPQLRLAAYQQFAV